jgi:hypothetical protein
MIAMTQPNGAPEKSTRQAEDFFGGLYPEASEQAHSGKAYASTREQEARIALRVLDDMLTQAGYEPPIHLNPVEE